MSCTGPKYCSLSRIQIVFAITFLREETFVTRRKESCVCDTFYHRGMSIMTNSIPDPNTLYNGVSNGTQCQKRRKITTV